MNKARKKRIARKRAVAVAYAKANAKPKQKIDRLRTPLGRLRVTHTEAIELKRTMRAIAWKKRQLAKQKEAEGSTETTE